jgi:hypothetical protein
MSERAAFDDFPCFGLASSMYIIIRVYNMSLKKLIVCS